MKGVHVYTKELREQAAFDYVALVEAKKYGRTESTLPSLGSSTVPNDTETQDEEPAAVASKQRACPSSRDIEGSQVCQFLKGRDLSRYGAIELVPAKIPASQRRPVFVQFWIEFCSQLWQFVTQTAIQIAI